MRYCHRLISLTSPDQYLCHHFRRRLKSKSRISDHQNNTSMLSYIFHIPSPLRALAIACWLLHRHKIHFPRALWLICLLHRQTYNLHIKLWLLPILHLKDRSPPYIDCAWSFAGVGGRLWATQVLLYSLVTTSVLGCTSGKESGDWWSDQHPIPQKSGNNRYTKWQTNGVKRIYVRNHHFVGWSIKE